MNADLYYKGLYIFKCHIPVPYTTLNKYSCPKSHDDLHDYNIPCSMCPFGNCDSKTCDKEHSITSLFKLKSNLKLWKSL